MCRTPSHISGVVLAFDLSPILLASIFVNNLTLTDLFSFSLSSSYCSKLSTSAIASTSMAPIRQGLPLPDYLQGKTYDDRKERHIKGAVYIVENGRLSNQPCRLVCASYTSTFYSSIPVRMHIPR